MANTVEGRFIGRLTPGSNRFNGAYQAGQGITDQLQDGNAFRVSPRIGVVYDLSGEGRDHHPRRLGHLLRPAAGQQVFDMICQRPGRAELDGWISGTLQVVTSGGGDPFPTLSLNPSAFDFKPPKVQQWNIGLQHKLMGKIIARHRVRRLQVDRPAPAGADQRGAVRRDVPPAESGSDPRPERDAGRDCAAQRLPAAVSGLRQHPDVGLQRLRELPRAADVGDAPVRRRLHVHGFWVWSKALGINSTDVAAGVPNLSDAETRRLDYSLVDYDRPHNFLLNSIYQRRELHDNKALGLLINDWQLSGAYRWTSGRPYAVNFNIPGIGAANLTGTDGNPNARIVLTCDPGSGYSSDPYRQINTCVLRAAAAR